MTGWKKLSTCLDRLIRPQTHPLSIKLLKDEGEFPPEIQLPKNMFCVIQAINLARRSGLKVGVTSAQFSCGIGLWVLGWARLKEGIDPLQAHVDYVLGQGYYRDRKAAMKQAARRIKTRLEPGKYKAMLITTLAETIIEPDVVLIYGNSAQMSRLIPGAIYHTGEVVTSVTHTGASCASEIVTPILKDRAQLIIPGTGERRVAMTQDNELAFALPADQLEKLIQNLEIHYKRGIIRYPISFRLIEGLPRSEGPMAEFREKLDIIN